MKVNKTCFTSLIALSLSMFVSIAQGETLTLETLPKAKGVAWHAGTPLQLHVATDKGLYVSRDKGLSWNLSYPFRLPATMISETTDSTLYAFVVGKGLLRMRGSESMWTPVNNKFGAQVLTQLSVTANDPNSLIGLNQYGKIIVSSDGGVNWHRPGGSNKSLTESGRQGQKLFTDHCQSCHGVDGVGETYTLEALTNKNYVMAPALDESAHAWHHTDEALVKTILDGSQRTERMVAWKTKGLDEKDAKDLVVYIKSLWDKRALECQGPKHMQCM
ncbi:c-type cytochrome [endosymbiont of Lamellibrachia barhami]|uniref:c-type cytochrome n=1 Tax=endosymbiont of Lamellibrachia barhami TaxID=205975 RepID=UPI0015B00EE1|nr:cytochrome c [endosymbiont of Lamellibrachia barhami]